MSTLVQRFKRWLAAAEQAASKEPNTSSAPFGISTRDRAASFARWYAAIKQQNIPVMKHFLDRGVDPNADVAGLPALGLCALHDLAGSAQALFDTGRLNIDHARRGGPTALWLACERSSAAMALWLLGRGADPNHINSHDGTTPLAQVCLHHQEHMLPVAQALVGRGANLLHASPNTPTPEELIQEMNDPAWRALLGAMELERDTPQLPTTRPRPRL